MVERSTFRFLSSLSTTSPLPVVKRDDDIVSETGNIFKLRNVEFSANERVLDGNCELLDLHRFAFIDETA